MVKCFEWMAKDKEIGCSNSSVQASICKLSQSGKVKLEMRQVRAYLGNTFSPRTQEFTK